MKKILYLLLLLLPSLLMAQNREVSRGAERLKLPKTLGSREVCNLVCALVVTIWKMVKNHLMHTRSHRLLAS
jgi:hypothetical protein